MEKQRYICYVGGVLMVAGGFILSAAGVQAQNDSSLQQLLNNSSQSQQQGTETQSLEALLGDGGQNNASSSDSQSSGGNDQNTDSSDENPSTPEGVPLSQEELLKRGDEIQDKLLKNPNDQEELNKLLNAYVKQNYDQLFYTKTSSRGEIKMLLRNKRLYQGNKLTFVVVPQHVNKALDFKNASYTWTVKRGNTVVASHSGTDEKSFYFTPEQTGPYIVHVDVTFPNNTTKSGRFPIDVYNRTDIDYRPLNPAKGDAITVRPAQTFEDRNIVWKLNGKVFARNTYAPSFKEFKGYGSSYTVEAIIKDTQGDDITHYGKTQIQVQKPGVHVRAHNAATERTFALEDSLTINTPQTLTLKADARSFPEQKPLTYIFRKNNTIEQKGPQSQYKVDVDPEQTKNLTVTVQAGEDGEVAQKVVKINPNDTDSELQASVVNKIPNFPDYPYQDFLFLSGVIGLGLVLVRVK